MAESAVEIDQLRQRAYEAAYSAEKARAALRSAEKVAGALLSDEATAKAGHDLMHDLSLVMSWLTVHDRVMKAWREALAASTPPDRSSP